MDIIYRELDRPRIAARFITQTLVEGDIDWPQGSSPDKLLCTCGHVSITGAKCADGAVEVTGRICVDIHAQDRGGDVISFSSWAAFRHTAACDGATVDMKAEASAALQTLDIELFTTAARLSAITDISVIVRDCSPLAVIGGIKGVPDTEYDELTAEVNSLSSCGDATLRLREEFPETGVSEVLFTSCCAVINSAVKKDAEAELDGDILLSALVRNTDGALSQLTRKVPFTGAVPIDGDCRKPCAVAECSAVRLYSPGSEFSVLALEAMLDVTVYSRDAEVIRLPLDAFSPTVPFSAELCPLSLTACQEIVSGVQRVSESISIPEDMPPAASAIYCTARPLITSADVTGGVLTAQGLMFVYACYYGADERIYSFHEDVPFSLTTAVALPDGSCIDVLSICACAYCEAGGSQLMLTADIVYSFKAASLLETRAATAASAVECADRRGGLIVYFTSSSDTAFSIAKRFAIPVACVEKAAGGSVSGGEKLIFIV